MDELFYVFWEWMVVNKILVSVDVFVGEMVEVVLVMLLKISKAMRAMKKNGDDLKRELEEFMVCKVVYDEVEIDDWCVMVDFEK